MSLLDRVRFIRVKIYSITLIFFITLILVVACASTSAPTSSPPLVIEQTVSIATSSPTDRPTAVPQSESDTRALPAELDLEVTEDDPVHIFFSFTYQQPDGNRLVTGQGAIPEHQPIDIPLVGEPAWVIAAPTASGDTIWAVALADGRTQGFRLTVNGNVEEVVISPAQLPPGMPPLLRIDGNTPTLPVATTDTASLLTHPIFLSAGETMVSLQASGELIFWNDTLDDFTNLEINALPDARILVDEAGRLLLLTEPTSRYAHGVLGDTIEAASITLVETSPSPRVALTIPIADPTVIEGIAPIWADISGDGQREIIVTRSNSSMGAQVVAYNEAGEQIAAGPAIGRGGRWRHQLVVAPFGPEGEHELADVLTPHIGGTVEFYRLNGDNLEIVARVPGYTSHVIGTRNLDMAVAGDFDGEGRVELLLPNQARTELGAIRRNLNGAEVVWTIPVGGVVTTNLSAVATSDGRLIVGAGRSDDLLILWGS